MHMHLGLSGKVGSWVTTGILPAQTSSVCFEISTVARGSASVLLCTCMSNIIKDFVWVEQRAKVYALFAIKYT